MHARVSRWGSLKCLPHHLFARPHVLEVPFRQHHHLPMASGSNVRFFNVAPRINRHQVRMVPR